LLERDDEAAEIAVAGEQDDVVKVIGQAHGVDRQLDVHVALDLAPARGVGELLGWLRHHRIAVVVEPIYQRANGRVFLVFDQGRVVERANQMALLPEQLQEPLVIDVEAQGLCGGVQVGSVDKECDAFVRIEIHIGSSSPPSAGAGMAAVLDRRWHGGRAQEHVSPLAKWRSSARESSHALSPGHDGRHYTWIADDQLQGRYTTGCYGGRDARPVARRLTGALFGIDARSAIRAARAWREPGRIGTGLARCSPAGGVSIPS
jgi:hypothetical protein